MSELLGPLGLPGAVASLLAAVWFGVGIRDKLSRKPNGNGAGDWRGQVLAATTNVASATAHLTQAVRDMGLDLSEIKARTATTDLRVAAIATREDLNLVAEKNRHATRNELTPILAQLGELEALIQSHDAWERGRAAAGGGA